MRYSAFFDCMNPWAKMYKRTLASYILFLNVTDNVKEVKKGVKYKDIGIEGYGNEEPPQRYYKYATGGNEINSFAYKIQPLANKEKFITFLKKEASGSTIKEMLFNNFKEHRKDIKKENAFCNIQNLFDDIADTFLEIINEASQTYEKSPRNNPRKNTSNSNQYPDYSEEDEQLKDEILRNLVI